jgi:16S rRNA G1207 methylase RsmC
VLQAKGYTVTHDDFLSLSWGPTFDRVVMNPPFSDKRWRHHVEHAVGMLLPGGVLVAVLPKGAELDDGLELTDCDVTWHDIYEHVFTHTGIWVILARIEKKA